MSETMVTVVGNVATAPVFRELPSGTVARFRLAATARRRDRETGQWTDGHTNFFTIWAWRALGENVAASVSVGEPVIVQGKLKVRQDDRGGGQQWMSADIDAIAVGHDLSRGTTAFRRTLRTDGVPAGARPAQPGESRPEPGGDGRPPVQLEQPLPGGRSAEGDWPADGPMDGPTGGITEGPAGNSKNKEEAKTPRPTRRRTPEPAAT